MKKATERKKHSELTDKEKAAILLDRESERGRRPIHNVIELMEKAEETSRTYNVHGVTYELRKV